MKEEGKPVEEVEYHHVVQKPKRGLIKQEETKELLEVKDWKTQLEETYAQLL